MMFKYVFRCLRRDGVERGVEMKDRGYVDDKKPIATG